MKKEYDLDEIIADLQNWSFNDRNRLLSALHASLYANDPVGFMRDIIPIDAPLSGERNSETGLLEIHYAFHESQTHGVLCRTIPITLVAEVELLSLLKALLARDEQEGRTRPKPITYQ